MPRRTKQEADTAAKNLPVELVGANLTPLQREILIQLGTGATVRQVATLVGCHKDTVTRVRKSAAGKRVLEAIRADQGDVVALALERLRSLSFEAVATIARGMLGDKHTKLSQVHIAQDLLDRIGVPKSKTVNTNNRSLMLTTEDIRNIKQIAGGQLPEYVQESRKARKQAHAASPDTERPAPANDAARGGPDGVGSHDAGE